MTRHSIATVRLCTAGVEETEAAGAALAAILAPGTVVGLVGPLGAGKTCFVRGMASRLGVDPALVASPTFVYLVDYPGRDLVLYHADLYRLVDIPTEAAEAAYEGIGLAAAFAAGGISVVEWWSGYRGALPPSLVRVEFAVENAEHRQLTVVFEGSHASEQAASFVSEAAAEGLKTSGRAESMARKYRIVQKYGGTSVGSPERIRAVARRVKEARDKGWDVAVVVSAMAGETNRLLALAHEIAPDPNRREVDVLIATGEQVATALVTLALHTIDVPAVSFQGHQVKVMTDSTHGHARIKFIDDSRVQRAFDRGQVVVIAGFQGIDEEHNITTLGRGGSDTTAVAIAAALKADVCEIYTDVDGVYTTDPRICPDALKLDRVSHEEMLESASVGAKVLQIRSVECAMRHGVSVHVRSSFNHNEGTWVVPEETSMEDVVVTNIACEKEQAKITLAGVPDVPGLAAQIFGPLAKEGIVVDMIVQNVSHDEGAGGRRTDLTFTVSVTDRARAVAIVDKIGERIGARKVTSSADVGKVSVVGLGMRSHAGVAADMFETLAAAGINIQMISTSEIKISVIIDKTDVEKAVRLLHSKFVTGVAKSSAAGKAG